MLSDIQQKLPRYLGSLPPLGGTLSSLFCSFRYYIKVKLYSAKQQLIFYHLNIEYQLCFIEMEYRINIFFLLFRDCKFLMYNKMNKQQEHLLLNNTPISINRSILNRSKSKRLNSFSKAIRFPKPYYPPYFFQKSKTQSSVSYESKKNIFPTIPKADKTFYFQQERNLCMNPSPQTYHIKHNDEIQRVTHRGQTFRLMTSRSDIKDEHLPGPLNYSIPIISRRSFNKTFTFHRSSRNLDEYLQSKGRDSPGPMYKLFDKPIIKQERKKIKEEGKIKNQHPNERTNNKSFIQRQIQRLTVKQLQSQKVEVKMHKTRTLNKDKIARNTGGFTYAMRKHFNSTPNINPGPGKYLFFSQFSGWK